MMLRFLRKKSILNKNRGIKDEKQDNEYFKYNKRNGIYA